MVPNEYLLHITKRSSLAKRLNDSYVVNLHLFSKRISPHVAYIPQTHIAAIKNS